MLFLFLAISYQGHADIPFEEAKGIWQLTKDEYKHISPFWGIAAIHGELLPVLRFFGNYNQAIVDGHEVDRGEEAIAELIRQLFNSPDGRLFVATTYLFNPAGDLSRHIEKINDIIMAFVNYDQEADSQKSLQKTETVSVAETENQLKTLSDEIKELNSLIVKDPEKLASMSSSEMTTQNNFKARIKEKQELIKSLKEPKVQDPLIAERNTLTKQIQSTTQQIDRLRAAKKQDAALQTKIQGLEAKLTNLAQQKEVILQKIKFKESQTPEQLRFNALEETLYQILEPIGSHHIASDENIIKEAQEILERTTSYIPDIDISQKDVVKALKHQTQKTRQSTGNLGDDVDWANSIEGQAADLIDNAPERAQALVKEYLQKKSGDYGVAAKKDQAYLREIFSHSPERAREFVAQVYQPRIHNFARLIAEAYVLQSKLANPTNPKEQVYAEHIVPTILLAFFAKIADSKNELKKLPDLFQDPKKIDELPSYTKQEFEQTKPTKEIIEDQNPEQAFLYGRGYEQYSQLILPPFGYRVANYQNNPDFFFPDCGENSLRYILSSFLSMGNGGKILSEDLGNLEKNIRSSNPDLNLSQHPAFQKFKKYMIDHSDLSRASQQQYHHDWADVVSNLNDQTHLPTINDVQYGHGDLQNGLYTYEIKSNFAPRLFEGVTGIVNMLNVIGKLIPDQVLNEPWHQEENARFAQVAQKLNRLCAMFSKEKLRVSWSEGGQNDKISSTFTRITFWINDQPQMSWTFDQGHFFPTNISDSWADPRHQFNKVNCNFNSPWVASFYVKISYDWMSAKNPSFHQIFPLIFSNKNWHMETYDSDYLGRFVANYAPQFMIYFPQWFLKAFPITDPAAANTFCGIVSRIILENKDEIPHFDQLHSKMIKLYKKFKKVNESNLLFAAMYANSLSLVEDLIKIGININIKNDDGETPLFHASTIKIFDLLIDSGADLTVKSRRGSLLEHYLRRGNAEFLLALLKRIDPSTRKDNNIPFYNVFLQYDELGTRKMFPVFNALKPYYTPDKNQDSQSPLWYLIQNYHFFTENDEFSLVMNDPKVQKEIQTELINLTDINDPKNRLLLHEAVKNYRLAILEALLKKGMDPNTQDKNGNTPLHFAYFYGYESAIKLLTAYQADQTIQNNKGETPKDITGRLKKQEIKPIYAEDLL